MTDADDITNFRGILVNSSYKESRNDDAHLWLMLALALPIQSRVFIITIVSLSLHEEVTGISVHFSAINDIPVIHMQYKDISGTAVTQVFASLILFPEK